MFKSSKIIDNIQMYLAILKAYVNFANSRGYFDINKNSEDFFCKLLNVVFKLNLVNLNKLQVNFPAIDLGDSNARICYQVTSRSDISRIKQTLDVFDKKELFKEYDKINILVLGDKGRHNTKLKYDKFAFTYDDNLLDLGDLLREITKKDIFELKQILKLFEDELSDEIIKAIKHTKENKELFFERKIISNKDVTYYAYGLGKVRVDAYLPTTIDDNLSCLILFEQDGLSDCMMSFNEETIKDLLFEEHIKGLHEKRKFVWYFIEDENKVGIKFPNNRFVVSIETAQQLCNLIDDLENEYKNKIKEITQTVGGARFKLIDNNLYYILKLPKYIWSAMVDFAQAHDYYNGVTEWDIFNPLNLEEKNHIIIYKNHLDKTEADILAELYVDDMSYYTVDVFWKPGYTPFVDKMEGFDNRIKWKVDYTHDWILEEFIPYIFYLDSKVNKSLFNKIIDKIIKKDISFFIFKKTFNYKKYGIESACIK